MFDEALSHKIAASKIIAVLVIDKADDALPLAETLLSAGIDAMELTLRTEAAIPALEAIRNRHPDMLAGVGTVLTTDQVDSVLSAGAQFAVSPGLNRRVVEYATEKGLPFGPGIMTPSDIEQGLELGCKTMKFFPAESSGGLSHLKSMAAPYLHTGIQFIPLGGLDEGNMASYLNSPLVSAIGGSWIAKRDLISNKQWDAIKTRAINAREIADRTNSST